MGVQDKRDGKPVEPQHKRKARWSRGVVEGFGTARLPQRTKQLSGAGLEPHRLRPASGRAGVRATPGDASAEAQKPATSQRSEDRECELQAQNRSAYEFSQIDSGSFDHHYPTRNASSREAVGPRRVHLDESRTPTRLSRYFPPDSDLFK